MIIIEWLCRVVDCLVYHGGLTDDDVYIKFIIIIIIMT